MYDISKYKYNMSIWLILLSVYVASSSSSDQPALSVNVTVTNGSVFAYIFNDTTSERFYQCLGNKNFDYCSVNKSMNDSTLETVSGCHLGQDDVKNTFTCRPTPLNDGFICKRGDNPYPPSPSNCLKSYDITDVSLDTQVFVTWFDVDSVAMESHGHGIMITKIKSKTFMITGTFISAVRTTTKTTITTTTTMAAIITTTRTTPAPNLTSEHISPDSSTTTATTTGGPGTDKQITDDDDNNNLAIVVGLAVGCIVVVVIIAIILVLFWRRKKRTASSSLTNNSRDDDNTDIYPYGDSTLNNVMPNVSSNTLNTNPNEPKPETYATVDPSRKLSKTKTSSDTRSRSSTVNNSSGNKSKQKKTPYSSNLDYTEVDLENDAVHYQRSSDDNSGQEIPTRETPPPLPPDPSAKPKYYPKTGEDSSKAYTQVVKKNKNKNKSAASKEGAGSSPAGDPSGYEEVVPHTETQYTTVDTSAKNTLKPAADGVYAKLHDPVRNITDVYNEVPAEVTC